MSPAPKNNNSTTTIVAWEQIQNTKYILQTEMKPKLTHLSCESIERFRIQIQIHIHPAAPNSQPAICLLLSIAVSFSAAWLSGMFYAHLVY